MDRVDAVGTLLISFLDSIPSAAMLVDVDARLLACNKALLAILGRPFSELHGTNVLAHFPPELARIRQARFDECIATGEPVVWEDEREGRAFLNTISPTRGLDGTVVGAAIYAIEITEQRRLERERESLAAKLAQAQKLEAVGRLAGGVAHDFNNLLTALMAHASMALEDLPPRHPVRKNIDQISLVAERAALLTRQLLAFSRREASQPQAIDLREAVERSIGFARRLIDERVDIDLSLGPEQLVVHVDPVHVDQVVLNLATNARDAMPEGGTISVRLAAETIAEGEARPAGEYASLWVSDTGCGVDRELVDEIFDPFFTTKPVGQGTGLGLSTAFGILSRNGGSLALVDTGPDGTTFRATFPRLRDAPEELPEGGPHDAAPRGAGRVVLLVEDDAAVRSVGSSALRRAGFQVVEAENGAAALALLEKDPSFDVLLSDLVMPGLMGTELVAQVRARWPAIRTVLMSGYVDPSVRTRAEDLADFLLAKPFAGTTLVAAIAEVLKPH